MAMLCQRAGCWHQLGPGLHVAGAAAADRPAEPAAPAVPAVPAVVDDLMARGVAVESDGAKCVFVEASHICWVDGTGNPCCGCAECCKLGGGRWRHECGEQLPSAGWLKIHAHNSTCAIPGPTWLRRPALAAARAPLLDASRVLTSHPCALQGIAFIAAPPVEIDGRFELY